MNLREEKLDARLDGWAGERHASVEPRRRAGVGGREQEPDPALADLVVVNDLLAQRGDRQASRFDMLITGMSNEETAAAIASWEALGKPETAREREVRLQAAHATPEAAPVVTERAEQAAQAPKPGAESQTPPGSPAQAPERRQDTDFPTTARTASAIWETPKPPLKSLMAHRTEWALYDDLHGYGRRPRALSVKTPSKAPGPYEALLHPNTGAAYERDRRQAEWGDRGYGE